MCANWMNLRDDILCLEQEGIDYLHYDVMDGFFCPDYCLGTHIIKAIQEHTVIPSDFHLMVEEPLRVIQTFSSKPGDILTIHYEACRNLHRDLVKIKQLGFRPGLALNPATTINLIEYVIEEVDVIKVMTVNPGYAGQKLVEQTINKIAQLDELRKSEKLNFEISVDGNVNSVYIPKMVAAGADILIGGSSGLFVRGIPLKEAIVKFRSYIEEGFKRADQTGN